MTKPNQIPDPDPELAKRKAVAQPKAPKAEGVKPDPRKLAAMLQRMG